MITLAFVQAFWVTHAELEKNLTSAYGAVEFKEWTDYAKGDILVKEYLQDDCHTVEMQQNSAAGWEHPLPQHWLDQGTKYMEDDERPSASPSPT